MRDEGCEQIMVQRLDKLLSSQGIISRSEAQRLVRSGRVKVDGAPVRDPAAKVEPDTQTVELDGRPLTYKRYLYIMCNKPAGLLCVSRDPKSPTVIDLLPPSLQRRGLFPAGRLDKDTVGLVLIPDDGDFAHRLLQDLPGDYRRPGHGGAYCRLCRGDKP